MNTVTNAVATSQFNTTIFEQIIIKSKAVQEYLTSNPEFKEKLITMVESFPGLPNSIEDMILYYLRTLEYYNLYELDPFHPRLDRVDQKLEELSTRLGLKYEISKNVKLKARQLLAYA